MKYEVSNYEYMKSHFKAPRGTGHWAFTIYGGCVENIAPETFCEKDYEGERTTFWVPGVMTLSEAKKKACDICAEHDIPRTVTIYVAP